MNILKKFNDYWNKSYPSYFVTIGLLFMLFGVFIGMVGYHNFDISQNLMRINLWINYEYLANDINLTVHLKETTINDGGEIELIDSYRIGVKQVFMGAISLALGALIFASGLTTLEHRAKIIK